MPFDGTNKGATAVRIIDKMIDHFGPNGEKWCRGARQDDKTCLIIAYDLYVANEYGLSAVTTMKYLYMAITKQDDYTASDYIGTNNRNCIINFNDTRGSYRQIKSVLMRARELAMNDI